MMVVKTELTEGLERSERKVITDFFIKVGLYANLRGFDYLLCAVEEVIKSPSCMHSITKELYPRIATKYQTTTSRVERNMRNAIDVVYNKGKLHEVANRLYGANFSKYEKPTNGEFISFLINIAKG